MHAGVAGPPTCHPLCICTHNLQFLHRWRPHGVGLAVGIHKFRAPGGEPQPQWLPVRWETGAGPGWGGARSGVEASSPFPAGVPLFLLGSHLGLLLAWLTVFSATTIIIWSRQIHSTLLAVPTPPPPLQHPHDLASRVVLCQSGLGW